jgi:phage gp29-like protein
MADGNDTKQAAPKPGPQRAPGNGRKDITAGYVTSGGLLSPSDYVLMQTAGGRYEVYEDVLGDDQVMTALSQRFLAVTSCEWDVEPASESAADVAIAEFVKSQLHCIGWDRVTFKMLFAVYYGYSVAEMLWEPKENGARLGWKAIKVRKRQRFGFNADGELRLRTLENYIDGEACDPQYFWSFNHGADNDDDHYGKGLAHWLYWPVYFKRNGVKFWLIFLEKFGMPTMVGKFPAGVDQTEIDKLLETAGAMATDAAVAVPLEMELETVEAKRSGTADYKDLCSFMDAAISKVVNGQTLTTQVGDSGSRALGDVHERVGDKITKSDADLVCESFNLGPVKLLVDANFAGITKYPRVYRKIEPEENLDQTADRDVKLKNMGYKRTMESVTEVYGEGYEEAEVPELLDPNNPAAGNKPAKKKPRAQDDDGDDFAEANLPDQLALDHALDLFENGSDPDALQATLEPVLRMLDELGPADTLARFAEVYPLNMRSLQERVAKVIFVAQVWGRIHGRE